MKWGRIVMAGLGAQVAALLLVMLVVTGYAFKLAFAVHGAPDPARIAQFAEHVSRSCWWILQILLAVPAAAWTVRKTAHAPQLHGVLTGLVIALVGLALGYALSMRAIAEFALTIGAGWLGAALARYHGAGREGPQTPGQDLPLA